MLEPTSNKKKCRISKKVNNLDLIFFFIKFFAQITITLIFESNIVTRNVDIHTKQKQFYAKKTSHKNTRHKNMVCLQYLQKKETPIDIKKRHLLQMYELSVSEMCISLIKLLSGIFFIFKIFQKFSNSFIHAE